MAEYTRLQNTFASGYVDPTLHGLVTTDTYGSGLKTCLNFLPSTMGYLYRRPGTHYLGISLSGITKCRIHAVKTDLDPVVAVISVGRIDFYTVSNNTAVASFQITDGTEYDALGNKNVIPWEASELDDLDIYEFEGSLYIVHPNHKPCRVASLDRGLATIMVDETVTRIEAEYDGPSVTEDKEKYLTQVFGPSGLYCEELSFEEGGLETFDKSYHYPACQTFKGGRWYLSGCKNDPATIYASRSPDADGNYRFTDFRVGAYYLAHVHSSMVKTTVYTTTEFATDIDSVSYDTSDSTTTADQQIGTSSITVPDDTSTTTYTRYTDAEGTTVVDGSTSVLEAPDDIQKQTKRLDVTTTADTWSLESDLQSDDAIELTESDMYGSRVNWLLTQQRVIAGTSRSIWMDTGSAATPSDFDMVKTLGVTTSSVKPVMYSSMIIFVPADLQSVKAFYYDTDSEGYTLIDLSASARSLFKGSTVKDIALVEGLEPILWVLLDNGKLLSCTIGAVYGWAEHSLGGDGTVEAIFPYQAETGTGSLFLVVTRGTKMTVERMVLEDLVNTDVFTLCDCSTTLSPSGGEVDFTDNTTYVEGSVVQIVAGGWPRASYSFAKETVDIGDGSTAGIYIGYPYTSVCTMLWQELPTNASQSSLSFFRKATSMALLLYRSAGAECGWYAGDKKHLDPFQRLAKSNVEEPTYADYFTGIVKLSVPSNTSEQVHATIECTQPLPMTIQGIETRYVIQEA